MIPADQARTEGLGLARGLLILALLYVALAVTTAVMLGAIVVFGGWGPWLVVLAGAAIMRGLR